MNGETLIHFFTFLYFFVFILFFFIIFYASDVDEMHLNKCAMILEWGNKLNEGYT